MPKRASQDWKANMGDKPRAMSSVFGNQSGQPISNKERDRHGSFGGFQSQKTSSPGPGRSQSPNNYVTKSGQVVDMSTAYLKLSDANLSRSEGSLADLPTRPKSNSSKEESLAPGGGVRLATDDYGDDEAAVESSENDDTDDSDGDNWGRGRQRRRSNGREKHGKGKSSGTLMSAAEEERKWS